MKDETFYTLHRHWIWCEVIKDNLDKELRFKYPGLTGAFDEFYLPSRRGAYKAIWYGLLYSVLETLKESNIDIEPIQSDVADIYQSLRNYRNAVFHPQPKYWSDKICTFINDKAADDKIQKIHEGLRNFFFEELVKRKPPFTYRYEIIP